MIFRTPSYYEKFRCIADKCTDNCCIGWEIDIDSDTAGYYSTVSGKFGKRLSENIREGSFVLTHDEKCPFLNGKGLCDIFTELGEEHLCQICTDHPRYYEWFGNIKEGGVGLCCEEATRLILSEDMSLSETCIPDEECDEPDPEFFDMLISARDTIIRHISRDSDMRKCLGRLISYAIAVQKAADEEVYALPAWDELHEAPLPDIRDVLPVLKKLEPMSSEWLPFLDECSELTDKVTPLSGHFLSETRRIAAYFIFRYFMKSVFSGDILSPVTVTVISTLTINYLWECQLSRDDQLPLANMAAIAKNYSKEIEYNEDNLEKTAWIPIL